MEILVFFLVMAAVRGLVHQTQEDLARWRGRPARTSGRRLTTHGTGYWLNQLVHGFPSVRHGFMDGWGRGMAAHHEARRGIAEHRTRHAERRAALEPELTDLRIRRRQALDEINRKRETDRAHAEAERANQARDARQREIDGAYDEAKAEDAARTAARPEPGTEPEMSPEPRPKPAGETCDHQGHPCREPLSCFCTCAECIVAYAGARVPAPGAGTDDREPAAAGMPPDDSQPREEDLSWDRSQPDAPAGGSKGDGTVGETNVASVEARMEKAIEEADERRAEADQAQSVVEECREEVRASKEQADSMADDMQALGVDPGTLSAMSDHQDALDETGRAADAIGEAMTAYKDAWAKVSETGTDVKNQLVAAGHKDLEEAHANAAGGGAEKEFYDPDGA